MFAAVFYFHSIVKHAHYNPRHGCVGRFPTRPFPVSLARRRIRADAQGGALNTGDNDASPTVPDVLRSRRRSPSVLRKGARCEDDVQDALQGCAAESRLHDYAGDGRQGDARELHDRRLDDHVLGWRLQPARRRHARRLFAVAEPGDGRGRPEAVQCARRRRRSDDAVRQDVLGARLRDGEGSFRRALDGQRRGSLAAREPRGARAG